MGFPRENNPTRYHNEDKNKDLEDRQRLRYYVIGAYVERKNGHMRTFIIYTPARGVRP